jgi:hypothetical protein
VKRLRNWIAGILSGVVAYHFWKRRQKPAPAAAPPVADESDDRAEELRTKLAEARAGDEPEPVEQSEQPEPSEPPAESLEERRRRVHEEGRAAIDEMRSDESE